MEKFIEFLKNNIFLSICIVLVILLSILSGYLYYLYTSSSNIECPKCDKLEVSEETPKKIYVDIKGSVKNPGVYEASEDNIINDVINMAGGFKSNAYKNNINLSKKVSDELVVYVFSKYEYSLLNKEKNTTDVCTSSTYNIDNCKESSVIVSGNVDTKSTTSTNEDNMKTTIVNINTATISELTTLPGLGEKKAEAIIKYREEHGNFEKIEDITNVSGIGNSIYESIKDLITV
jgi:competence protein ComEA